MERGNVSISVYPLMTKEEMQVLFLKHSDLLKTNPVYQDVVREFQGSSMVKFIAQERNTFNRDARLVAVILFACFVSVAFSIAAMSIKLQS